ncbi:MAG: HNH endonuclease [Peptococcaceae bacterium]|nr:HNH endonuclease [Peptococcaceae bacterium]
MSIEQFQEEFPSLESYWRSIILFGRNVASYKFALAKSLLEIAPTGKTEIYLEDLAEPFSRNLCEHIAVSPKQITSQSSRFLDACKNYNNGTITHSQLMDTTVSLGFNNVIDAFHVVNEASIPVEFYKKDYSRKEKKLILTDELFKLKELPNSDNFLVETEARWNLVETAWALNISRNLLNVKYDDITRSFFTDNAFRRKDITSARWALNGYQKGKCFYCYRDINVSNDTDNECDIDHFFPHTLQRYMLDVNLDGVWNLVLTCPECNRGINGKFAKVPHIKYLARLHKRNEFLINSHHPLRETIIQQTGKTEGERRIFMRDIDQRAINFLIHRWETPQIAQATF